MDENCIETGPQWFSRINGGIHSSRSREARRNLREGWDATDRESVIRSIDWLFDEGHRARYANVRRFLIENSLLDRDQEVFRSVSRFRLEDSGYAHEELESRIADETAMFAFISQQEPVIGSCGIGAWDFARVGNVLRLALVSRLLRPADCWGRLNRAARLAQLSDSFLAGRRWWNGDDSIESNNDIDRAVELMLTHPQSPWMNLDWNLRLELGAHPGFLDRAQQGDAEAQYRLGRNLLLAQGVARNPGEAVKWLRMAAVQGHIKAQTEIGTICARGDDVPQDYAEAVKWYQAAAEQGAFRAQINLAYLFDRGLGVSEDHGEAAKWYRKAAEQGHIDSMYTLGQYYARGHSVPRDYSEAARWYRDAAENGNLQAQERLGVLYHNGRGVKQDPAEAAKWFRTASEWGSASEEPRDESHWTFGAHPDPHFPD